MTQAEFADRLDLSRDQIAGIEYGSTLLRYGVARRLCLEFDVNAHWLATGNGESRGFLPWVEDFPIKMAARRPFSEIFSNYMAHRWAQWSEEFAKSGTLAESSPGNAADFMELETLARICEAISRIKHPTDEELAIGRVFRQHFIKRLDLTKETPKAGSNKEKGKGVSAQQVSKTIDTSNPIGFTPPMSWPDLKERLARATQPKGMRSELARAVGVTRQAVSLWLKDKSAPAGKTMLQLLSWVEAVEAQQSPANVTPSAGQETQKGKKDEIKSRPSRRQKR